MTTVINFNILNFFSQKLNTFTLNNDIRSYHQYLDYRRQNYPQKQDESGDIIDITPSTHSLIDAEDKVPAQNIGKKVYLPNPSVTEIIYNRKGKPVQGVHAKGLFVDIYA
jgi:hypothetical protein